jgi:multidrug resistance efflux pump
MPDKENIPKLELRSEEVQEILTRPPAWIVRWGISLIFLFTVIILVLAFLIRYPDFVAAKVLVTTEIPTEKLVSRTTGALEKLAVKNKDTVTPGTLLAVFRNTAKSQDVFALKQLVDSLKRINTDIDFPMARGTDWQLGEVEPAYIGFEKAYLDYRLLLDLDRHKGNIQGYRRSLAEIRSRLGDQIEQKQVLEQEYDLKKKEYERHGHLFEKGVISQQEYEGKQLEFLQMEKNISTMAISISQLREAVGSADQNLWSGKLDQREDLTKYRANLSQALHALKKAIADWEHAYVLRASITGVISFQAFWGANQNVLAGETVFSIMPLESQRLVGKLTIAAQNAGKVKPGQKTLVKLDNFPYQQYGMLVGSVKHMSLSPDKEDNYFIYIDLPKGTTTSYKKELPFTQELLGNAEIITEDLSVGQRILYKLNAIFKKV